MIGAGLVGALELGVAVDDAGASPVTKGEALDEVGQLERREREQGLVDRPHAHVTRCWLASVIVDFDLDRNPLAGLGLLRGPDRDAKLPSTPIDLDGGLLVADLRQLPASVAGLDGDGQEAHLGDPGVGDLEAQLGLTVDELEGVNLVDSSLVRSNRPEPLDHGARTRA